MKKRIAFVLVAGLMVVGYLLVQPESEPAEPTMAEVWARTADASLDIRMERFFSQMPDDLASAATARCAATRARSPARP